MMNLMKKILARLKLFFIPHVANGHRPHFLLDQNIRQLLGVVVGIELVLFALPTLNFVTLVNTSHLTAVLPGVLSALTNQERGEQSLPQLIENPVLSRVAQLKAEDMAAKSYFAHTSPEGRTPWYWFNLVGYQYDYAGENLAVNFTDSQDVTEAWINSPGHRANIVAGVYTEMGTGIATGVYQGNQTIFVAQVYGKPASNSQFTISNLQSNPNEPISNENSKIENSLKIANSKIENSETVLGESVPEVTPTQEVPTLFEKAVASPRQTTDVIFMVVTAIMIAALIINIFIKFSEQHPDLIANGLMVVVIIFGLHIANIYIAQAQGVETTFIAFEAQ